MPELICIDFAIKNQGEKIKWDWFSGAVDFPSFLKKSNFWIMLAMVYVTSWLKKFDIY